MRPTAPTSEQSDELVVWRSLALERMPYLASTLLALRPLDAPGLGTFAVDTTLRLYIDFEAVTPKGPVWCAEALLHECCHFFGDHAARSDDAAVTADERQMWNLSADAEANDDWPRRDAKPSKRTASSPAAWARKITRPPSSTWPPCGVGVEPAGPRLARGARRQATVAHSPLQGVTASSRRPPRSPGVGRGQEGWPRRASLTPVTISAGSSPPRPTPKRCGCGSPPRRRSVPTRPSILVPLPVGWSRRPRLAGAV